MNREPYPRSARRTVRFTRIEAIPFAIMTGLTDPYMVPYTLALGGSAFQAGLLSSVRNLVLSLSQLGTVRAIQWVGSRKKVILWAVGIQAALWIPIALARPAFGSWAVPALIALFTIGSTSAALGGPAWGSLVSEQLPRRRRGEFFGVREMLVGLTTAAAGLLGGAGLHVLAHRPVLGFGLLFGAAAVFRFISWQLLSQLSERPWHEPREAHTSLFAFIARARYDNFVRFVLSMGAFGFAVNLVVPYLTVYMLQELHFGYFTYSVVVLSGTMLGNLLIPRWGRIGDRRGNRTVLRLTMAGASILPFLWPWFPHPLWLLAMHLVGGFAWGGLNLAAVNFVYDATSPATQTRYLAYFNVIYGCCISLGTLTGGWLLGVLPRINGSAFITLFIVSASCRCLATVLFDATVKEVRPVHQIGLRQVMTDLVGQRLIQVLGYFAVRTERQREEH